MRVEIPVVAYTRDAPDAFGFSWILAMFVHISTPPSLTNPRLIITSLFSILVHTRSLLPFLSLHLLLNT